MKVQYCTASEKQKAETISCKRRKNKRLFIEGKQYLGYTRRRDENEEHKT